MDHAWMSFVQRLNKRVGFVIFLGISIAFLLFFLGPINKAFAATEISQSVDTTGSGAPYTVSWNTPSGPAMSCTITVRDPFGTETVVSNGPIFGDAPVISTVIGNHTITALCLFTDIFGPWSETATITHSVTANAYLLANRNTIPAPGDPVILSYNTGSYHNCQIAKNTTGTSWEGVGWPLDASPIVIAQFAPSSGAVTVNPLINTSYELWCFAGTSELGVPIVGGKFIQSQPVTISVPLTPAPTVSLTQSPASTQSGVTFLMTWSSTNADSCTMEKRFNLGAWGSWAPFGAKDSKNDFYNTGPVNIGTHDWRYTCTNVSGPDTETISHNVTGIPVTFNANGGSGSMSTQDFEYNIAENIASNAFTRSSYTFTGWGTSAGGPVAYSNGQSITIRSGMTLYAQWTAVTQPDLTADAISGPQAATVGVLKSFSTTIRNIGTASTGAAFNNFLQISDATNGTGNLTNGEIVNLSAIAAGDTRTYTGSYRFPTARTYSVRVCADKSNKDDPGTISESNNDNNCGHPWTDVAVSAAISAALNVCPVSGSVAVGGNLSLKAWHTPDGTAFNGCANPSVGATDRTSSATWSTSNAARATVNSAGTVTGVSAGSATITATYSGLQDTSDITVTGDGSCMTPWGDTVADGGSVTAYQNATVVYPATCASQVRNCTAGSLSPSSGGYTNKTCTVVWPDLKASQITPTSAVEDTTVTLRSTISNEGTSPTARDFYTRFQRATSDDGDNWQDIGTHYRSATLGISGTFPATFDYNGFTVPGSFWTRACADEEFAGDSPGRIPENTPGSVYEGNNCGDWTPMVISSSGAPLTSIILETRVLPAGAWSAADRTIAAGEEIEVRRVSVGTVTGCSRDSGPTDFSLSPPDTSDATVTEPSVGNTTVFGITCTDGTTNASDTVSVTKAAPPPPPPTATLLPLTSTVLTGQSKVLTWSSTNATTCTSPGFNTAGEPDGEITVGPLCTDWSSYTTCTGSGGNADSPIARVIVEQPSISITADPERVRLNSKSKIEWSADPTYKCSVAGPGLNIASTTSGSRNITITTQSKFTISCTVPTCSTIVKSVIVNLSEDFQHF